MVDMSIPAPEKTGMYFSDTVILYGVKLNSATSYGEFDAGENGNAALQMQLFRSGVLQDQDLYSVVLGYGYAFEGHCYRMDTKRVFIVKSTADEPAVGCGFDAPPASGSAPASGTPTPQFSMWRIRASEDLLEVSLSYGDVKKLILDANLPGRRSPSSYAITASLAHRDGRLNRD